MRVVNHLCLIMWCRRLYSGTPMIVLQGHGIGISLSYLTPRIWRQTVFRLRVLASAFIDTCIFLYNGWMLRKAEDWHRTMIPSLEHPLTHAHYPRHLSPSHHHLLLPIAHKTPKRRYNSSPPPSPPLLLIPHPSSPLPPPPSPQFLTYLPRQHLSLYSAESANHP